MVSENRNGNEYMKRIVMFDLCAFLESSKISNRYNEIETT